MTSYSRHPLLRLPPLAMHHSEFEPEVMYHALERIASGDGVDVSSEVLNRLVDYEIAELGDAGRPRLTAYGQKCHAMVEAGERRVPEFEYE